MRRKARAENENIAARRQHMIADHAKADKAGAKVGVTAAPSAGSTTMGTSATGSAKVTTAPAPSTPSVAPMPKSGG